MRISKIFIFILFCCCVCFASEPISWVDEAGFYDSNYPYSTKNEKAKMLYSAMIKNGEKGAILAKKIYRVKVLCVYNNGIKIWPVKWPNLR